MANIYNLLQMQGVDAGANAGTQIYQIVDDQGNEVALTDLSGNVIPQPLNIALPVVTANVAAPAWATTNPNGQ